MMVYVYNGILLRHKMEGNNAICSNMNGPRDYHIEVSQRQTLYKSLICGNYKKKKNTNECIYKTETGSQT